MADRLLAGDLRMDAHELPFRHGVPEGHCFVPGALLQPGHQIIDRGQPPVMELLQLCHGAVHDAVDQVPDLLALEATPQRRPELELHGVPHPLQLGLQRGQLLPGRVERSFQPPGQRAGTRRGQ